MLLHFSVWLNSSWRHCAASALQLCVLIPVSLITLLCPHVTTATGVASSLGPECYEDERKAGGTEYKVELILAWCSDFWVELDLSVFQLHLAQKVRSQPPIRAHMVQSKQVGPDSFSLAGLPIAIGKKWEFIRGTQNTHKQLSVGDCLQIRIGQELSKQRGTKGWCCKKTSYNPWHHWWTPLQDRPK